MFAFIDFIANEKNVRKLFTPDFRSQLMEIAQHFLRHLLQTAEKYQCHPRHLLPRYLTGELLQHAQTVGEHRLTHPCPEECRPNLTLFESYPVEHVSFLLGCLEYILSEILELSHIQSVKQKHKKIMYSDLYFAFYYDKELSLMCNVLRLVFVKTDKSILRHNEMQQLMGTIQKGLPKKTRLFLHHYMETYILNLLKKTKDTCDHFGKKHIEPKDIEFVYQSFADDGSFNTFS